MFLMSSYLGKPNCTLRFLSVLFRYTENEDPSEIIANCEADYFVELQSVSERIGFNLEKQYIRDQIVENTMVLNMVNSIGFCATGNIISF